MTVCLSPRLLIATATLGAHPITAASVQYATTSEPNTAVALLSASVEASPNSAQREAIDQSIEWLSVTEEATKGHRPQEAWERKLIGSFVNSLFD